MNYKIEIQRNDVTLAEFFSYVKNQCAKKGIGFDFDRDEFENPRQPGNSHYYVKDGIKHCNYDGYASQHDASDAACKSETLRVLPYDYQCYILNFDGSCYNEICEFTFDDDKRGHGYYYQINTEAREQAEEHQKAEIRDDGMIAKKGAELNMTSATEKRRVEFAERVARSLDSGVIPWQRKDLPDMPVKSAVSGRQYSGLNALRLMDRCAEAGYTDPRFITASEANKNGLHVRKGEHGVVLEHWTQGENGKIIPRGYSVFNVQQLNGSLPIPESEKISNLEKATAMLKNAGMEMSPDSSVKEYRDAIKKLTVKNAEESGLTQIVHTPELLALRCSLASTAVMREVGVPVEQAEGAPIKSWAQSIKHDPSQLSKAARDGGLLAGSVLRDMTQSKEAELFQANMERAEAQKGQELVSEAATVPRGLDSNLPNADLSGVQESVIAASDKARTQVNDLRASASGREANIGTDKLAAARDVAKKQLGNDAIVTSAVPGRTYSGKIIGAIGDGPDKTAIQAISNNHAILHDIRDISAKSNIRLGEEVSLTADEQGYSVIQSKGPETHEKHEKKNELAREGLKR